MPRTPMVLPWMDGPFVLVAVLGAMVAAMSQPARAQLSSALVGSKEATPLDRNQPVAFTADNFDYDRAAGIVTASGHVEAWQNDHVLRADKITFDRNTNVAAATGNVVMVEPDGQVLFADYAELTQGMREGVLRDMRALLAENGKLAANGARRTDGKINELTRAVYTTCDLCKTDPTKPPLWQIRALTATQDLENHRIEYQDATIDMLGVPVAYLPYLSHPDPSVRRASGFLVPSFGQSSHVGQFLSTPYFWAIDPNQDLTLTPAITTGSGEELAAEYRRRFNNGVLRVEGATAIDQGKPQGYIFAKGTFAYDDTWRYGFNINRASSTTYLRDFRVQNYNSVLSSTGFIEGFGVGAYTKLDAIAYQGLATSISQEKLPYVLPRYEYSFFGEEDPLGGRFRFDTTDFNVLRQQGNNTQRAGASLDWQRPFSGELGEQYKITIHADMAAYQATDLNQQPAYGSSGSVTTARAQPTIAAEMRWPFMRDGGNTGSQIVEPIVQLIGAPNSGSYISRNIPNEDSLDYEFTDANLFAINRFPGIDRFEGGARANVGVHGSWTVGGANLDALVGQSYREHIDNSLPLYTGLGRHMSDVVARATVTPASWLDVTARTRVNPRNGNVHFADVVASAGTPLFRPTIGYLYSSTNPYFLFDQSPASLPPTGYPASYVVPRDEITLGASTQYGPYKLTGYARRDLTQSKLVALGAHGTYEDECFILDVNFFRRYTSINNDHGGTTLLFQITLKPWGSSDFTDSNGNIVMRLSTPARLLTAVLCLGGTADAATMARPSPTPAPAPAAPAAPAERIVAIVNGDVISQGDVEARGRLFALSTGLPMTPDVLARLRPQVTQELIDDRLRLQEEQKRKIIVSDKEIADAVAGIEQRNGMQPGALRAKLGAEGVALRTLYDQTRVQLGWTRVLRDELGPRSEITAADIAAQQVAMKAEVGQTEYRVGEIFLPINDPSKAADTTRFAETVIGQLHAGAPFAVVAAQFSGSQTALQGGDLGWVHLNQFDPQIVDVLRAMPDGAVSNPITVPGGISIVTLRGKREVGRDMATMLSLRQVFLPFSTPLDPANPTDQQKKQLMTAQNIGKTVHGCDAMEAANKAAASPRPADPGEVRLEGLSGAMRTLLTGLPPGQVSRPLVSTDGVGLVMICASDQKNMADGDKDAIGNRLLNQRVELVSRQLLRDLRRRANIDLRG